MWGWSQAGLTLGLLDKSEGPEPKLPIDLHSTAASN